MNPFMTNVYLDANTALFHRHSTSTSYIEMCPPFVIDTVTSNFSERIGDGSNEAINMPRRESRVPIPSDVLKFCLKRLVSELLGLAVVVLILAAVQIGRAACR